MKVRSVLRCVFQCCLVLGFSIHFDVVSCQTNNDNDPFGKSPDAETNRIFQELAGDFAGTDDSSDGEFGSNSRFDRTPTGGFPKEGATNPSQEDFGNRPASLEEDDEVLQTIMSLTSSATSWLKSYLIDSYHQIPNPSRCVNDTTRLIDGVLSKQKWTTSFIDAAGKPGPSLTLGWLHFVGNLDQCENSAGPPIFSINRKQNRKSGFSGQYCEFRFSLVSQPLVKPTIGLCVPDSCSDVELLSHSSTILRQHKADVNLTLKSVECIKNEADVTTATTLGIILLAVIGGLVAVGTWYDLFYVQKQDDPAKNETHATKSVVNPLESSAIDYKTRARNYDTIDSKLNENGNYNNISHSEERNKKHVVPPLVSKVLLAFSAYTNGRKALSVSQDPSSIGAINGIRFLSISWVVLGHTFYFGQNSAANFPTELSKYFDRWSFSVIFSGFFSVDSFFALSGLLTSYLTLKQMTKKTNWKINWPMFYFHRFWRLTPPYMAILVISQGFLKYMGSGPMWPNDQPYDKQNCEDDWWKNLLYINNLYKMYDSCVPHAWFLANDMQFFVLSPFLLIPMFFHPVAGLAGCGVLILISMITTGVLSSSNDWIYVPFAKYNTPDEMLDWLNDYYTKPWNRIGPYVVGILAGFVLTKTKGKSFEIKWWLVALGWILSTATALSLIYGVYGDTSGDNVSSTSVAALYNAVSRHVWGLVIGWIIIACDAGYGGPINTLLSWKPFIVLGRLTFMTYLIHPYIMMVVYSNIGQPYYISNTTTAVYFLGFLTISTSAAFVAMLLFESPMIALEKVLIGKREEAA